MQREEINSFSKYKLFFIFSLGVRSLGFREEASDSPRLADRQLRGRLRTTFPKFEVVLAGVQTPYLSMLSMRNQLTHLNTGIQLQVGILQRYQLSTHRPSTVRDWSVLIPNLQINSTRG